jgi:hypothetical protein
MDKGGVGTSEEPDATDVAATVADRLKLLRPVLTAQAQHGLSWGVAALLLLGRALA